MDRPRILFVDDEQLLQNLFERLFTRNNLDVLCCSNAEQAIAALAESPFDLVVTDFMMPDMDGLQLLSYIRQEYPDMRVIMITAHANVQHAVRTMQSGAIDYIPKPFSTDELVSRVQAILATPKEEESANKQTARKSTTKKLRKSQFIGEHPTVRKMHDLLDKLSTNTAPVFIQGESGTGKEVLSRLLHESSDRSTGPFIAVNCANLPRELVESHLFGHRKGSFTGAIEDMSGAFELADGGTLLLDEITEIDLPIQAKLLRVLQESEFRKVGATAPQKVDVRVVATSNRRIGDAIAEGIFREDLYHRLSVFPLSVPPLRERISDVPLLSRHFLKKYCDLYGLPMKDLSDELLAEFHTYSWPGNVRQLENLIQRGVVLSAERSVVEKADVFDSFFTDSDDSPVESTVRKDATMETIDDMERYMILQALNDTNNNQQLAARRLGISARTIRNKLKKYREEGHIA